MPTRRSGASRRTSSPEAARARSTAAASASFLRSLRADPTARASALRAGIEASFLAWARSELPRRKAQRNVIGFEDLLTRLHGALHSGLRRRAGASIIRDKFRAALIDEFQDTDAIQDAIFRKLFRDGTCWLYLIGDPKQAIYGFRGADVFTYLNASQGAPRFQLGTATTVSTTPLDRAPSERRSSPQRRKPVRDRRNQIRSRPGLGARGCQGALPGRKLGTLPAHFSNLDSGRRTSRITDREQPAGTTLLPQIVAAEASLRACSPAESRSGRPPARSLPIMAVLVMTNRQARLVQAALE